MLQASTVIKHGSRAAYRELAEGAGAVVLHLDTAAYHGLNEMGNLIWTTIGDGITFEELVARVRERVDDAPPNTEEDVSEFVEQLAKRDLVVLSEGGDETQ